MPQKYSAKSGLATSDGGSPRRSSAVREWATRVGFFRGVGEMREKQAPVCVCVCVWVCVGVGVGVGVCVCVCVCVWVCIELPSVCVVFSTAHTSASVKGSYVISVDHF